MVVAGWTSISSSIKTNNVMIQFLKKLLGIDPSVNFKDLVAGGAQIIDVRTKSEYQSGHIKGSVNIPLQSLSGSLSKIKRISPLSRAVLQG
jgi:3-mercaptopyruvate sulfurtransferase SseA